MELLQATDEGNRWNTEICKKKSRHTELYFFHDNNKSG
jgi:5-keto 4-deoxyuronate isomerase